MAKPAADPSAFRYERKFLVSTVPKEAVEHAVRVHPAGFRELYPARFVNNCYFDSPRFTSFRDAVEGSRHRVKVRVRWYGELFGSIPAPVLEIKEKAGLVGRKAHVALAPLALDRTSDLGRLRDWSGVEELPADVVARFGTLRPSVINRYARQYLLSADRRFRITIDTDLQYYRVTPPRLRLTPAPGTAVTAILEIKYDGDADAGVSFVTSRFPFRLTKSSKYVMGVRHLGIW